MHYRDVPISAPNLDRSATGVSLTPTSACLQGNKLLNIGKALKQVELTTS